MEIRTRKVLNSKVREVREGKVVVVVVRAEVEVEAGMVRVMRMSWKMIRL